MAEEKFCPGCRTFLDVEEFSSNISRYDGLQGWCKGCMSIKQKDIDYTKARDVYFQNNKDRLMKIRNEKRAERKVQLIVELGGKCVDCGGVFPPCVMDFDHLGSKSAGIGVMLDSTWDRIAIEISKCELVCSNCHRIRTFDGRL